MANIRRVKESKIEYQPSEDKSGNVTVNDRMNQMFPEDKPVHNWYRFVLSYPPHLVRTYLERFDIGPQMTVLDPFCGTGTTLVECKKKGISSIGIEANPMAFLASTTKLDWLIDPGQLKVNAELIAQAANDCLRKQGIEDGVSPFNQKVTIPLRSLDAEAFDLLLTDSISPLPLHKTLTLLDSIRLHGNSRFLNHYLVALAKCLVTSVGNLHFGPEVGIGDINSDASVIAPWMAQVQQTAHDLRDVNERAVVESQVFLADAREIGEIIPQKSVDAIITSPPYPNEKDYTRTTRLESVILGLIQGKNDLKALKRGLIRSNTRNVYTEDMDDDWIKAHPEIEEIAGEIEQRRIDLGKTSGFERLYARVTRLYFGGMARHLDTLRPLLKPGAKLAYVVGDQASYLRVMIRTGQLLAKVAEPLGYRVRGIDLFRTRLATATREQLREEVVLLEWTGTRAKTFSVNGAITVAKDANRYTKIVEYIFAQGYTAGATEIAFTREQIVEAAQQLSIKLPKNLGDVIYSFRYRIELPKAITNLAPEGTNWIIRPSGTAKYVFVAVASVNVRIIPNALMAVTKVPDSTPGLIAQHALSDEQALLAKLRYNRLIDIFTGITCYSLQNHLRTTVKTMGQLETDEIYVGVDRRGAQYVLPVQAKGGKDQLSIVQIEQDIAMCAEKFPNLICKPIAAQFLKDDRIAVFQFEPFEGSVRLISEKHYQLVPADSVSIDELRQYSDRTLE